MLDGHARGLEAGGGMRGELVFEGWSPAEGCKQRGFSFRVHAEIGSAKPPSDTEGAEAVRKG
jgi:hypothetical protein